MSVATAKLAHPSGAARAGAAAPSFAVALQIEIGDTVYLLDVAHIVEVLPLAHVREIPGAPAGLAGALDYRGAPVPVVDLTQLILHRPAQRCLSTRLVLVRYPTKQGAEDGSMPVLGLYAERATETLKVDRASFRQPAARSADRPFLGAVMLDDERLLQWIDLPQLLSGELRSALLHSAGAGTSAAP